MKKALIWVLAFALLGCMPVLADNGGIEDDWGDVEFEEEPVVPVRPVAPVMLIILPPPISAMWRAAT